MDGGNYTIPFDFKKNAGITNQLLTLIPPQLQLFMKSTGVVTFGVDGKRNKKSNSTGLISLLIRLI